MPAHITRVNPASVHVPFSAYSHVVEVTSAERFLFCSGQVPADADGGLLPADNFDEQLSCVLSNICAVLTDRGASLSSIVRLNTYLTHQEDVPVLRTTLAEWFSGHEPANSVVLVQGLTHPDIRIEIEATAVV